MANLILSSFGHVKNYENLLRTCYMAMQDRKYLVSLDRFIAWSPLVFRPGRAKDEDENDCPFPDGTVQKHEVVQLIKTDKAADRPEIKTRPILIPIPMSIQIRKMCVRVRVPGLVWSRMLLMLLGGWTEVSSSNCEVTKGLQLTAEGFHAVR